MADTTTPLITMKLLVDPRPPRRRVVLAEAGKDAVDFLFSLLAMPAGTAVKVLGKESMVGSVGNLYASLERLDDSYVRPGAAKDALLCPAMLSPAASPSSFFFRLPAPPSSAPRSFFTCLNCRGRSYQGGLTFGGPSSSSSRSYVTDARGARCPSCGNEMTDESQYVPPPAPAPQEQEQSGATKGLVQGAVTYTVTDDLTVTPMSAISSVTRLGAFAMSGGGLGALQEKTVQLGYKEGLEILKASLQSKTVLTDVFLGTGRKPAPSNNKNGTAPSSNSNNNGRRYECLTWRV